MAGLFGGMQIVAPGVVVIKGNRIAALKVGDAGSDATTIVAQVDGYDAPRCFEARLHLRPIFWERAIKAASHRGRLRTSSLSRAIPLRDIVALESKSVFAMLGGQRIA